MRQHIHSSEAFVILQECFDGFVEVTFKEAHFALAVDFELALCLKLGIIKVLWGE